MLEVDTLWRVSEGCKTDPLGGSTVPNGVVGSKREENRSAGEKGVK